MAPKLLDSQLLAFRQDNPKRKGTQAHERYEVYKAATSVQDAVKRGASKADLANDIKQGFCTVLDGMPVAESSSPVKVKAAAVVLDSPAGAKKRRPASPSGAAAVPAEEVAAPPAKKPALLPAAVPEPVSASVTSSSSTASSSSAPATAQRYSDVDLTFAKFDGKPLKFVKRTMGEAKRLLSPEGLQEGEKEGYSFVLKDRDNLAKWTVTLRDLNPQGQLAQDLVRLGLDKSIDLELSLPDGFPMEPPFVRVVYPALVGGFVFAHGGICFEPLTAKGWMPSMTLPSLAIAIKGIMDYGQVRVADAGDKRTRTVKHYTEEGARRDHSSIVAAHRGGDANTYTSLKSYAS